MGLSTFDAFKNASGVEGAIELDDDKLHALQRVLMMMLRDIDFVCQKENIPYILGGGTCLGAVRHKGFIPWDDDIDINMTRKGYERFSEVFLTYFENKYWLHDCYRSANYDLAFPRVRLKGTTVRNRDDIGVGECGVCVDIFLIEDVPDGTVARKLHGFGSMAIGFLYSCRRFATHAETNLSFVEPGSESYKTFKKKIAIGKALSFKSAQSWTQTWDKWNGKCHNERSEYVTVPTGRKHYFKELYKREVFLPPARTDFETTQVSVAANADTYMTGLYGPDYMTPPAANKQEKHVVYEFDLGEYSNE